MITRDYAKDKIRRLIMSDLIPTPVMVDLYTVVLAAALPESAMPTILHELAQSIDHDLKHILTEATHG